ncbi:MAG: pantoate--beta-alanine ligase [Bacteroidota bacterium]
MKHFTTLNAIKSYLKAAKKQGLATGFVPTMGALHEGHLTLIRKSKTENDLTVCSIFVNPIQFNNKEDLEMYPRNLSRDAKLLEEAGCDVLFSPEPGEIYPAGRREPLDLVFGMLDKVMEGKFRPGHFKGVAIVVKRLFDIVKPDRAYFGKKDFQQLAVIRHLVQALKIPVDIVPCETVREVDGLAMSSRNMRLTIAERQMAPVIYQVLCSVKEKAGKIPVNELKEWAIKKIQLNPDIRVEYLEIGDMESLLPMENWDHKNRAVAFTAVFLGDVRLIDNIELFS